METFFDVEKEEKLPGRRISVFNDATQVSSQNNVRGGFVTLPQPQNNRSWPQAGGNGAHHLGHVAFASQPRLVWSQRLTSKNRTLGIQPPVVANGRVYSFDNHSIVTALDISSGRALWRAGVAPKDRLDDTTGGGIAFDGRHVIVATGFAQLTALNPANGRALWSKPLPAPARSAPSVNGRKVFVVTINNMLVAYDARTGRELWSHQGGTETSRIAGGASPALYGNTVVVGYASGEVYALLQENGRVLWNDILGSGGGAVGLLSELSHIRGHPVVDGNTVFVTSTSGQTKAIGLRDGLLKWEAPLGGGETPWLAGNTLFVVGNGTLAALDHQTGGIKWQSPLPKRGRSVLKSIPLAWSGPILAGNRLILGGSNGSVLIISPQNGKKIGEVKISGGVATAPIVSNGTLLVVSGSGKLLAYR